MQNIGPNNFSTAGLTASSASPPAAPSNASIINVVESISSAVLGNVSAPADTQVQLGAMSLCGALSQSLGPLFNKERTVRLRLDENEDWMEELLQCSDEGQELADGLQAGLTRSDEAPGALGLPIPGFNSPLMAQFTQAGAEESEGDFSQDLPYDQE